MFDLNTILSAALQQAVEQATKPLLERIERMQDQINGTLAALDTRITALENNPAIGADTTLVRDIRTALLGMLKDDADIYGVVRDVAIEAARFAAEEAIDEHCQNYDHDSYDNLSSTLAEMGDIDDYVKREELRSDIEEIIDNATISIRL